MDGRLHGDDGRGGRDAPQQPATRDATASDLRTALAALADPTRAVGVARYFKTGPGQYAEGDVFIGVRLPDRRTAAKHFADLGRAEIVSLLDSEVHEHRLAALLILVLQFERAGRPRTRNDRLREELNSLFMVATSGLILRGDARAALEIATLLRDDPEDLIQKAVGWMLREVGKRIDRDLMLAFLDEHAARMPRTALSYATEHLEPALRSAYRARR